MEVAVNSGCVLYKEGDFEAAAAKFKEAAGLDSSNPVRAYSTLGLDVTSCCRRCLLQQLQCLWVLCMRAILQAANLKVDACFGCFRWGLRAAS